MEYIDIAIGFLKGVSSSCVDYIDFERLPSGCIATAYCEPIDKYKGILRDRVEFSVFIDEKYIPLRIKKELNYYSSIRIFKDGTKSLGITHKTIGYHL